MSDIFPGCRDSSWIRLSRGWYSTLEDLFFPSMFYRPHAWKRGDMEDCLGNILCFRGELRENIVETCIPSRRRGGGSK